MASKLNFTHFYVNTFASQVGDFLCWLRFAKLNENPRYNPLGIANTLPRHNLTI